MVFWPVVCSFHFKFLAIDFRRGLRVKAYSLCFCWALFWRVISVIPIFIVIDPHWNYWSFNLKVYCVSIFLSSTICYFLEEVCSAIVLQVAVLSIGILCQTMMAIDLWGVLLYANVFATVCQTLHLFSSIQSPPSLSCSFSKRAIIYEPPTRLLHNFWIASIEWRVRGEANSNKYWLVC